MGMFAEAKFQKKKIKQIHSQNKNILHFFFFFFFFLGGGGGGRCELPFKENVCKNVFSLGGGGGGGELTFKENVHTPVHVCRNLRGDCE